MRPIQKRAFAFILCIVLVPVLAAGCASLTNQETAVKRIGAEEARAEVDSGKALLVCSYDDGKCKSMLLKGAMLRSTFEGKVSSLPMDQEIIFYCN